MTLLTHYQALWKKCQTFGFKRKLVKRQAWKQPYL